MSILLLCQIENVLIAYTYSYADAHVYRSNQFLYYYASFSGKCILFTTWERKTLNTESDVSTVSQNMGHFLSYWHLWHSEVPLELPLLKRPALYIGPSKRFSEEQPPLEICYGMLIIFWTNSQAIPWVPKGRS